MATGKKAGTERPLSDLAEERIRPLLDAAEETAERIVAEAGVEAERLIASAEAESERMIAGARSESAGIVERARKEAGIRIEQARGAVEGLAGQADDLRARIGALGEDLVGNLRMGSASGARSPAEGVGFEDAASAGAAEADRGATVVDEPEAEVPGPARVPEPVPPRIPEPSPDPVPEPSPDPVPEPGPDPEPLPDPVPEPTPDPGPGAVPEPPDSAGMREPSTDGPSTEALIAQLRGASPADPVNGAEPAPRQAEARLLAMNLALGGSSRAEIATEVRAQVGDVQELDDLLDDVIARAQGS